LEHQTGAPVTDLTSPIFNEGEAARRHFEALRWPDGTLCPHCGSIDNATELKGKSTRAGVYKCKDCEKPLHRDDRHRLRTLAYPTPQMVARDASSLRQQERHFGPSTG
jgi:transposase-like protein